MPLKHVTVPPERFERWLAGFSDRHGAMTNDVASDVVVVRAADGAEARCHVPFAPLPEETRSLDGVVEHVRRDRRVGVVLVRRGGHAVGVFDGRGLVESKVGARHVQGRTAAGGQSQQRFARRREKQAREAFDAAADTAARILLPYLDTLDAVVVGGDKAALRHVLDDRRLATARDLVVPPHLPVPDPRLAVLRDTPDTFRAVRITLTEPDPETPTTAPQ